MKSETSSQTESHSWLSYQTLLLRRSWRAFPAALGLNNRTAALRYAILLVLGTGFLMVIDQELVLEEIPFWIAGISAACALSVLVFLTVWVRAGFVYSSEVEDERRKLCAVLDKILDKRDLQKRLADLYFEGKDIYHHGHNMRFDSIESEGDVSVWQNEKKEWYEKVYRFIEEHMNYATLFRFAGSNHPGFHYTRDGITEKLEKDMVLLLQQYSGHIQELEYIVGMVACPPESGPA